MEGGTTPVGGEPSLKPCSAKGGAVGADPEDVRRAESVFRSAHQTSGLAAYEYFFVSATPAARALYETAMEAEYEAEALLALLRRNV